MGLATFNLRRRLAKEAAEAPDQSVERTKKQAKAKQALPVQPEQAPEQSVEE